MEEFKTVFPSTNKSFHKMHTQNLKEKLDNLIMHTDWECDDIIDHNYSMADVVDCIIYYVTGFVCKTMLKKTTCPNCCKAFAYNGNIIRELPEAHLVNIKTRGKLIHPNTKIFQFFKEIKKIFARNITSSNVYQETVENLFTNNIQFEFPCNEHKSDILAYCIHYYITLRMRQFAKQENHKVKKVSREKKKLSRLCTN